MAKPQTTMPPDLRALAALAALALTAACSTPATGGSGAPATYDTSDGVAADASTDAPADGASANDADTDDTTPTTDTTADTSAADTTDVGFPDGFFDPEDSSDAASDTGTIPQGPVGDLYAHTATDLYKLDLAAAAVVKVAAFTFDKKEGKVTDIAADRFGTLFAISHTELYECDRHTAKCAWKAALPSSFNGLTFVPEGVVDPKDEALIGMGDDGSWNHIQLVAGKVKIVKLGSYGGGWLSSGDAFSVVGIGTFATLKGKGNSDSLARIDAKSGKIEKILGETGAVGLFGLAWWSGVFYAFSKTGEVFSLDHITGKATLVKGLKLPQGVSWWGAGVSTRAAGG